MKRTLLCAVAAMTLAGCPNELDSMRRELNELNSRAGALKAGQTAEGQALIADFKSWAANYRRRSSLFTLLKADLDKVESIVLTWPSSIGGKTESVQAEAKEERRVRPGRVDLLGDEHRAVCCDRGESTVL